MYNKMWYAYCIYAQQNFRIFWVNKKPKNMILFSIRHFLKDSREAQRHIDSLEHELGNQSLQIESLTEEKLRLLREVAQLKAGTGSGKSDVPDGGYYFTTPAVSQSSSTTNSTSHVKVSGDQIIPKVSASGSTTISSVGALRLYEFLLGIFFIAAMLNYIFV